jgi:hypothetical protein
MFVQCLFNVCSIFDQARIIHEVKAEASGEEDSGNKSAEQEALDDEQARLREELRVKQEQEASTVLEEEQEDAVIDAITDPYALHLTSLKIENDMQKEAGAIQQNAYDRRVSGYGTIDNKLQVLVKKKADLVEKRKQFAGTNYGSGGGSGGGKERRDGDVARIEEMNARLVVLDQEVGGMLAQADEDMGRTREQLQQHFPGRDKARQSVVRAWQEAEEASKNIVRLRAQGVSMATVNSAELKAAAAFETLKQFEKDYELEAEKSRQHMNDRHQRQRDRMLVKLEAKQRAASRSKLEKETLEQLKQLQSQEELNKKKEELQAQGRFNQGKADDMLQEAKAAMIAHESHVEEQTMKRKARMEARMKAKRLAKKNALKRKHEDELARELAAQQEERKKLEGMSQREKEMNMLEGIMVRGANEERVDEAIEMIMHER